MPPPKSQKLLREQTEADAVRQQAKESRDETIKVYQPGEEIPIKRVKCYNDYVAILQFRVESTILTVGDHGFKNEGMVVGVGPGLPAADGRRVQSQLNLGDIVTFYGNPITALEPKSGVYQGQKIIIVPERSVICGLKPVPFKMVDEPVVAEKPVS